MNDIYTQDKMARNNSDYDGSGVGTGHYTEKEELRARWEDAKLPLVLLAFAMLIWAIILWLTVTELDLFINGEKEIVQIQSGEQYVIGETPDGNKFSIDVSSVSNKAEQVTIYYKADDYYTAKIMSPVTQWLMYYGFAISITLGLLVWLKKTLYPKKHAVADAPRSHKYDD